MSILKTSTAPTRLYRRRLLRFRWIIVTVLLLGVFYFQPATLTATSLLAAKSYLRLPDIFEFALDDEVSYLKKVLSRESVTPRISYASRTIHCIEDAPDRPSITKVDQKLLAEPFQELQTSRLSSLPESSPLELHIKHSPRLEQSDASSLLFACSTTFARFNDAMISPIQEWSRWLTDGKGNSNGGGLILSLYEASQSDIRRAADRLAAVGISATVVASDPELDMPGRYVSLVDLLYNHSTRNSRKYFFLIDDDTFFPALGDLTNTLSHYDHDKPYYIGTFTERARWLLEHEVPYAFGGGGIIMTLPLIKKLSETPCLEKNEDGRYVLDSDEGDRLLYNCIHEHTETVMTYLPSLHQEDQYGDGSGFYEAGIKALSLHHYKSWNDFLPGKAHLVTDACGEDCLLQRFQFKDDFILSNGYSVAQYPKGVDFDPEQMEGTFDIGGEQEMTITVAYAFGVLRKSLSGTGKKKSWSLVDSRRDVSGQVTQIYLMRKDDERWISEGEEPPANDGVFVLTWVP